MIKRLAEDECHYYQFFQAGENFPKIQVSGGIIQYWVKPGRAESEVEDPISIVEQIPTIEPIVIALPIHGDDRLYSLFVKGRDSGNNLYELFSGDADIASRNKKELDGLTDEDVGDCQHQSFS